MSSRHADSSFPSFQEIIEWLAPLPIDDALDFLRELAGLLGGWRSELNQAGVALLRQHVGDPTEGWQA